MSKNPKTVKPHEVRARKNDRRQAQCRNGGMVRQPCGGGYRIKWTHADYDGASELKN